MSTAPRLASERLSSEAENNQTQRASFQRTTAGISQCSRDVYQQRQHVTMWHLLQPTQSTARKERVRGQLGEQRDENWGEMDSSRSRE